MVVIAGEVDVFERVEGVEPAKEALAEALGGGGALLGHLKLSGKVVLCEESPDGRRPGAFESVQLGGSDGEEVGDVGEPCFEVAKGLGVVGGVGGFCLLLKGEDGASGAKGDAVGGPGRGQDTGVVDSGVAFGLEEFLEEVEVLSSFAFVHPAELLVSLGAYGEAGADGLVGMGKAGVA